VHNGTRYAAKVALLGAAATADAAALDPIRRLRWVVLRDSSKALALPGGYWSAELDGGDPSAGDEALIRTAMYGARGPWQTRESSRCDSLVRDAPMAWRTQPHRPGDGAPGPERVPNVAALCRDQL